MAAHKRSRRGDPELDETFDDRSGSDVSDCTDTCLSEEDEEDFFMDLGTDLESESSGNDSETESVVPLMDVGVSPEYAVAPGCNTCIKPLAVKWLRTLHS